MENLLWHTVSADTAVSTMESSEQEGLTAEQVQTRQKKFGPNALPQGKTEKLVVIFLRQFQSPLIYILMAAAITVYLLNHLADAAVVFFVLIFNAVTGTIQEGRAQSTLAALKKFAGSSATVLRGGQEIILSSEEVVPGDIIILQEGEKIPADARIIAGNNLQINEASLTGESEPVHKSTEKILKKDAILADQSNMVFKGTYITSGFGKAVVVATGMNTEIGKIAKEISQIDTEIPLKQDVARLSRLIMVAVLAISLVLLVLGFAAGMPLKDIFVTVVSLAISVIPEGLPIVLTLILAKGVWDMSKKNVLVKRLQAVEALGQTKIIAVDKTGTLTKNEMVVTQIFVDGQFYTVTGTGYEPEGKILNATGTPAEKFTPQLNLLARCAALSSSSRLSFDESQNTWRVAGDPTEAALLVFSQKAGGSKEKLEQEYSKINEIPFDYIAKYHAVVNQDGNHKLLTVMGAAEKLLAMSGKLWTASGPETLEEEQKAELVSVIEKMAKLGLRVVAAGYCDDFKAQEDWAKKDILTLAGFYGIQDALRPEVLEAMRAVNTAGMKVVMITGDHKLTAQAIAKQAGIFKEGDGVISGEEINNLNEKDFLQKLPSTTVFVRVTPEHKLKIVKAYRKLGMIVAMTGDGVNDAPSLVAADLGVSMGKIGTEVAKEASDIVLLDDNFGSIVAAVEEGRNIYRTIQKALTFLFSTAGGEILIISSSLLIGTIAGMPLPLLPAQILWVNLVGDGILGVFLAYEPKEPGLLVGNFKKTSKYIIDKDTLKTLIPMSIVMAAGTLGIFIAHYQENYQKALTMSFTALAMFQWFNAWNCKSQTESLWSRKSLKNSAMTATTAIVIGLHLLVIYTPFMQKIFHTVPLGMADWLTIIIIASSIIWTQEAIKFRRRRQLSWAGGKNGNTTSE